MGNFGARCVAHEPCGGSGVCGRHENAYALCLQGGFDAESVVRRHPGRDAVGTKHPSHELCVSSAAGDSGRDIACHAVSIAPFAAGGMNRETE